MKDATTTTTETTAAEHRLVLQPRWLSIESYSLFLLAASPLFYSLMACFVQLASRTGIPSTELVFLRAVFQGAFVVGAMFYFQDPEGVLLIQRPFGSTKYVQKVVIARGTVGGLGFLFYYYTMSVLPVGDATALLSLNPVITILAASIFLQESMHVSHVFAAVSCLVGSVLLAHPSFLFTEGENGTDKIPHYPAMGYLTAFLGCCSGACVFILMRTAGKAGVHVLQLLFSWCFFGLLYSAAIGVVLPVLAGSGKRFVLPSSVTAWLYILGVCVFGSLGHFLMNYAARHAPAGLASIVRSTGIMWSYFLEIWVFHQVPRNATIAGVALILLAMLAIALEKQKDEKEQTREADPMLKLQKISYGSVEDQTEKGELLTRRSEI